MSGEQGLHAHLGREVVPKHLPAADSEPSGEILGRKAMGAGKPGEIGESRMVGCEIVRRAVRQIPGCSRGPSAVDLDAIAAVREGLDAAGKAACAVAKSLAVIGPGHSKL